MVGGAGAGAGAGDGFGAGGGDFGGGVDAGVVTGGGDPAACDEISVVGERYAVCATGRRTTCRTTAARCAVVRWCGTIRTTGGAGACSTSRGVAAMCSSTGELDSKAARQRYPEVTPAATSRQSRSASNEIRTRISIDLLWDSIGADMPLR